MPSTIGQPEVVGQLPGHEPAEPGEGGLAQRDLPGHPGQQGERQEDDGEGHPLVHGQQPVRAAPRSAPDTTATAATAQADGGRRAAGEQAGHRGAGPRLRAAGATARRRATGPSEAATVAAER